MLGDTGPIYGVELIAILPVMGGMKQAMPSRDDLVQVRRVNERTVAGYEVLLAEWRTQADEVERLRNLYRTARQAHYDANACLHRGTEEWAAETEHFLEGGE